MAGETSPWAMPSHASRAPLPWEQLWLYCSPFGLRGRGHELELKAVDIEGVQT